MALEDPDLTLWTWTKGQLNGKKSKPTLNTMLSTTHGLNTNELRIISLPLDLFKKPRPTLTKFLEHHKVPSEFLLERDQGVNSSFGSMTPAPSADLEVTWLHFLCKDVHLEHGPEGKALKVLTPENAGGTIKANINWLHFSFVLLHTRSSSAGVTLLCFESLPFVQQHFEASLQDGAWTQILDDPYALFVIVIEAIWRTMDKRAWRLAAAFRPIERNTLIEAGSAEKVAKIDFANLHNISKHAIYLGEAFEAAQHLVTAMRDEHEMILRGGVKPPSAPRISNTYASFQRHLRLFKSTQSRLLSLEKRVANITNLSFNVVTQHDSRVMQRDSGSMHTIAIMTLVFLPGTLIATIFGSAFFSFNTDDNGSAKAQVSSLFWIFWAVALPCTAIVLGLWINFNPARVRKITWKRGNI